MENLIERVWEYSENNPDGFTLNLETGKTAKFGIAVSYEATQNSFGKESLRTVLDHSLKHQKFIGGWFNSEDGQYYFDSVRIFNNSEFNKAFQFAKENKQKAIFDLTNLKEIKIK